MVSTNVFPQFAAAMPFGPTSKLAGGCAAFKAKSVTSPAIESVIALPSPPLDETTATSEPGAAEHGTNGDSDKLSCGVAFTVP